MLRIWLRIGDPSGLSSKQLGRVCGHKMRVRDRSPAGRDAYGAGRSRLEPEPQGRALSQNLLVLASQLRAHNS